MAEEFRPWFGNLTIVIPEPERNSYRITLAGVEVYNYYGMEIGGRRFDDFLDRQKYGFLWRVFDRCTESRQPVYAVTPFNFYDGTCSCIERLLLPLGAEGQVTHIVTALYPLPEKAEQQLEVLKAS